VKVTLFDSEFKLLEDKNPYNSVAKLLRESALKAVKQEDVHTSTYSKLDRDFILELSRIGTNINQISKAINTNIAREEPFEAVKLLHLLIGIDETLKKLKESVQ
jgi:hypothetical protein